jgi:hypothetical protein
VVAVLIGEIVKGHCDLNWLRRIAIGKVPDLQPVAVAIPIGVEYEVGRSQESRLSCVVRPDNQGMAVGTPGDQLTPSAVVLDGHLVDSHCRIITSETAVLRPITDRHDVTRQLAS